MPEYTDAQGHTWTIEDWAETSFKGAVINQAHRKRQFVVIRQQWDILGAAVDFYQILYLCGWCHRPIPSSAVAGDHLVGQVVGRSDKKDTQALFKDAEDNEWNLVLSCNECNSGSRNKANLMTRGDFKSDREFHDPKPPKGGGGGGGKAIPAIVIKGGL